MKKKYILSALAEMILMMVACLFSSSQLNTLILSFAFDFVFLKYFYNPYMISDKERIKKEIKEYNQKKNAKLEAQTKNNKGSNSNKQKNVPSNKKAKVPLLSFDEEYFERRNNAFVNAMRLFIYCTCIIPAIIYDTLINTKTSTETDMKLNLIGIDKTDNAVLKFSNHIKTCVKLNTLMNLFFIGAIIMILILWLSPELKAISKIYVTKEDEFKDKRDLFEKEDFLYLLNQEFSHSTEQ